MRILFLGLNYAPELTGIGKYSGEMMEWLAARGHEVRVVTAPPYYPAWKVAEGYSAWRYRKEISQAGVKIYRCPLWVPDKQDGARRILHLMSFAASSLPLMAAFSGWDPDIVITVAPAFTCAPVALLASWMSRAPSWLHIQDFEVDAAFDLGLVSGGWVQRLAQGCERMIMRTFSCVSTISTRMMDRLAAKGVDVPRTILFPNWVDISSITPQDSPNSLREELGLGPDKVVALYSGNMGAKQGLEILPQIAERLLDYPHIHFVFCGNGAYHAQLAAAVEGMGNVTLLPLQPVERLNDLLNLADIHLLPQRAEAADLVMPSKLTGMLASGRPVAATAARGTQVAAAIEGRGIRVDPGNADAFACAVLVLADAPRVRKKMGAAARAFAESELAADSVLQRFEAEISNLANR